MNSPLKIYLKKISMDYPKLIKIRIMDFYEDPQKSIQNQRCFLVLEEFFF